MFTIISFFQRLIKGEGVGIRAKGLENFSNINNQGGRGVLIYFSVRGRAAEEGIIFRILTPEQGIIFVKISSMTGSIFVIFDSERSL